MLKDNLDSAIQEVVSDFRRNYRIDNYNPDFSRQRVLTMEMVINLLLSMQGGSLKKELYHARWGIETAFRELKYGIGLVNLHGKKDDFVKQEIYAAMTMANFCSRIVNEVVVRKNDTNVHEYKVNMSMAIHICRQFFRTKDADVRKLLLDIARYTEPVRPGRRDERNIKAKTFVGFIYRVSA